MRPSPEEKVEREAKARAMFAEGASVNAVAFACYRGYWPPAKRLKDEIDGVAPARAEKKQKKGAIVPKLKAEIEAENLAWDLTLQLPTDRLDSTFLLFTPEEKANAIQAVLQARLDALEAADG